MPSAARSAGGSFDSSTPGPAIGDPESATSNSFPSFDSRMPRGRLPTAIRSMTWPPTGSMTRTLPPVSSETYSRGPAGGGGGAGVAAGAAAPGDEDDDDGDGDEPPHEMVITAAH